MSAPEPGPRTLHTPVGDLPLHEYHLRVAGRALTILHTGALLTNDDEAHFLSEWADTVPYGVALWPSAIALTHELLARADALRGARVLELGAGTGLPGIVAASLGASVVQTDRNELALSVCRRNGARNGAPAIEHRLVDWAEWGDTAHYDWIIGSDILYHEAAHPDLRRLFAAGLAPGGRILIADPFRARSLRLLETLEGEGWTIGMTKWQIGEAGAQRPIGLFELAPPP